MCLTLCISLLTAMILFIEGAKYQGKDLRRLKSLDLLPPDFFCGISTETPCEGVAPRIKGGVCKAKPGAFPWMARILLKVNGDLRGVCGGTIINYRYVLTAAHCIRPGEEYLVHVGSVEDTIDCTNKKCTSYQIESAVLHENYNTESYQNDIALLRLSHPIQFSVMVRPICLPLSGYFGKTPKTDLTVAGWGRIWEEKIAYELKYDKVPVQPTAVCAYHHPKYVHKTFFQSTICAGDHRDTCKGDSGGPMMFDYKYFNGVHKYYLLGIVSFGQPNICGPSHDPEIPGVYTKVNYFIPWILSNMRR